MSKKKLSRIKQSAWSMISENNLSEAATLFSDACQVDKKDVESWYILGGLYGQLGQYKKAEASSRKAISLQPDLAEAHDNLGIALLEQGKAKEAVLCHQRALRLKPLFFQAHFHLGNAYRATGNYASAEKCYQDTISINGNMVEAHNNLGNTLLELGRPEEAEISFRKTISIKQAFPGAFKNLGLALQAQGNLSAAIESLKKGLEYEPANASIYSHLGSIYRDLGRLDDSAAHLERASELNPDYIEARVSLCNVLTRQGKLEEAMTVGQKLARTNPDAPDATAAIANIYEKQGKYDHANEILRAVKDRHPENINIAMSLALLSNNLPIEKEAIGRLEAVLDTDSSIDNNASIQLHALLGGLYDKTGEYDKAFENFKHCSEMKKYPVDMPGYTQEISELKDVFSRDFFNNHLVTGSKSELPVFILGMPRSGTSLVEQILCSHPLVYGAGELEYLNELTFALPGALGQTDRYPQCVRSLSENIINAYAEHYLEKTSAKSNRALRITDKMPHNFLHLGLIQLLFPGSRVIHCTRDPRDTCLSCYFQDFGARHPYTNDLANLGKYYRLYQQLMRHWKDVLSIPILDIEYEQLAGSPEEYSRKLIEFCGLEWHEDCLQFYENNRIVHTASYNQVRQPVYTSSIGRWKKYERFIEPLKSALAD